MRKRKKRKRGREGEHPRSLEKKSERERPHPTFSTIFVSLLEVGKWFEERKRRGRGRKRLFLTRVLRVLFFRKWGPELNFKRERERERGVLSIGEGFERVPLGRSAVEKAEKLAEPGQADTAGSRLRRNLIGYVCRRKSSGSLYIYVCIYTYAHLSPERGGRRGKRLVPLFSIVFLAKSRLEISTFPPFPRRSRIKLPGTRTGINFVAERARVEIRAPLLNHSRKLRSERFRTKRGR